MRIAVCGGTGFIGQALCKRWLQDGHDIVIVTRSVPKSHAQTEHNGHLSYLTWDEMKSNPERFEHLDALINLAGSSLSQRWTREGKQRILQSRQKTVSSVAELMHKLEHKPAVIVQASAMAIYGTSEHKTFDEESPATIMDFPSEVVSEWEQAADHIPVDRLIKLRISVVLGNPGGALPKMLLPYKAGVGGKIGSGKQWLSWIHINDIVDLIDYCVRHKEISGAVNAASPHAVRNDEFGRCVAKVYHRPHWLPLPAFMLQAILGEMSLILLKGQRIVPAKALRHGFQFRYAELTEALRQIRES
ncbi:TIGR01777 family oxidoreductase [Paenibacillus glucanolyticus]|uniref:Epimerase n=1 Tax=Paenibacillus glucanolyticus TaxID=59843 RepID=A0A163L8F3_9BACL|nr:MULTISPECIES: TIGR01777 family oxidoreductase [Paenibacillus]AWP28594.1 TIGR01777 family protein [Paenibacillus sp. Cedars]KZS47895.1 epimerase [Paenibacillus glucanolyticus]